MRWVLILNSSKEKKVGKNLPSSWAWAASAKLDAACFYFSSETESNVFCSVQASLLDTSLIIIIIIIIVLLLLCSHSLSVQTIKMFQRPTNIHNINNEHHPEIKYKKTIRDPKLRRHRAVMRPDQHWGAVENRACFMKKLCLKKLGEFMGLGVNMKKQL